MDHNGKATHWFISFGKYTLVESLGCRIALLYNSWANIITKSGDIFFQGIIS